VESSLTIVAAKPDAPKPDQKSSFSFAPIVDKVDPSVVSIYTFRHSGQAIAAVNNGAAQTSATGLIIRSDGYILTSAHVVHADSTIVVGLSDKRKLDARLIGRDPFTDLAVIKVDAKELPIATFGDSTRIRAGDWAVAIGSPLGFEHSVTLGVISAVDRSLGDLNNHVDLIQTDAAINFGNSGGPLIDSNGEVIGIITAVRNYAQNIAFAVPTKIARETAEKIIDLGTGIARPYLGIYLQDISSPMAKQLGLSAADGVVVKDVVANGPGHKAGLFRNDLIGKIDGIKVKSTKEARAVIGERKPGSVIVFSVLRNLQTGGKNYEEEDRKVIVGSYPDI
jgi:serine protease Do